MTPRSPQPAKPRKYPGLKAEYEELLLKVYESPECDRSEEGDAFVPPDPSMEQLDRNDERKKNDRF